MSRCVQNIVNAMVFVRFTVLRKFEFSVSRGRIWASFWQAFGDHGITFLIFEGTRKMLEFRRIFDECCRPREIQARGSRGGVVHLIGPPTSPLGLSPKIEEEKRRS